MLAIPTLQIGGGLPRLLWSSFRERPKGATRWSTSPELACSRYFPSSSYHTVPRRVSAVRIPHADAIRHSRVHRPSNELPVVGMPRLRDAAFCELLWAFHDGYCEQLSEEVKSWRHNMQNTQCTISMGCADSADPSESGWSRVAFNRTAICCRSSSKTAYQMVQWSLMAYA